MRFRGITFIFLMLSNLVSAQVGGKGVYQFLNLEPSARVASLGSKSVAFIDDDVNMTFQNPALLNSLQNNHISLNYVDFYDGINFGKIGFAQRINDKYNMAAGLQYINYGAFQYADITGERNGYFYAAEYAANIVVSRKIDNSFSIGLNAKPLYSVLESYSSTGIAFDLAASYQSRDGLFVAGLVLKNMGTQFTSYSGTDKEPLPFEIVLGVSKKLKHAPFRFILTAHQLQQAKLDYTDPATIRYDPLTGNLIEKNKFEKFGDNFMRHVIVGVEFLPFKSFTIRAGYNYQRRKEMQLVELGGMTGFSLGFGLNIKRIRIDYGRATYHVSGPVNLLSVSTHFGTKDSKPRMPLESIN